MDLATLTCPAPMLLKLSSAACKPRADIWLTCSSAVVCPPKLRVTHPLLPLKTILCVSADWKPCVTTLRLAPGAASGCTVRVMVAMVWPTAVPPKLTRHCLAVLSQVTATVVLVEANVLPWAVVASSSAWRTSLALACTSRARVV